MTLAPAARNTARLLAASTLACTCIALAQPPSVAELPERAFTIGLDEALPLSARIRTGEFDNGLHYYIRENDEPSNRIELRLAVDVGSVLEDDDQLGLAHFLEHMAFNGSENFQKQELVGFMESIGMRLGPGVNASTSFDETIYQLRLPADNPEYVNTAFQMLEDWAVGLTIDSEEIDLERGVVIEEWRGGQSASSRIRDKQIPVLLKDSKYAERLPIGTLESLQNFDHESLRRFYQDWYRPELMAVIAVGDFDADDIESLIEDHFGDLPSSENARERVRPQVPAHDETLFSIVTDPELPVTQISVLHMLEADMDWTVRAYRQRMVEQLYNSMLNARFQQISVQPDAPFLAAGSSKASLVRTLEPYALSAAVPETGIIRGLEALLIEAERVDRHGFTQPELDRAKAGLMRSMTQAYTNREGRSSGSFASEFVRAYLTGEAAPGIAFEYALHARFVPDITLAEVDRVGSNWISDTNRVVSVTAPQKPDLQIPSEQELRAVLEAVDELQVEPYEETNPEEELLSVIPEGSLVVAEREREGGITEWTLGNGVRVVLKPTDFQEDQIMFTAVSPGGASLASDDALMAAETAAIIPNGGVGSYSAIELQRELAGKLANVSPFFSEYEEGLRGSGSGEDLETMFQLIYLRMTAPRADPPVFEQILTQTRTVLANRDADPGTAFSDTFNRLLYQDHPRRQPMTVERLEEVNLDESMLFYRDRFADASDFTFVFVGSFEPDTLRPLVETYIGGLPSIGRDESWRDVGVRYPEGVHEETVERGLEPTSQTRLAFPGEIDFDDGMQRVQLSATAQVVQTRLRDVMREELGGTYGVSVGTQLDWRPEERYVISVGFGSDPERTEELNEILIAEIEKLQEVGPEADEVADTITAMRRNFESSLEQNAFWMGQLANSYSRGLDEGADPVLNYFDRLDRLDVEAVHEGIRRYFDLDNYIRVTLMPEI